MDMISIDKRKLISRENEYNKYIDTMTIFSPDISKSRLPRYQAIADAIAEAISKGTLRPGDRLPPHRTLAYQLGVTVGTVSRAYTLTAHRGLVEGEVGRGTYVSTGSDGAAPPRAGMPFTDQTDGIRAPMKANLPANVGQEEAVRKAAAQVIANTVTPLTSYLPRGGSPAHKAAGAKWLARLGLETGPDQVILTAGAQQAIAAALAATSGPGDTVLAEALTYHAFPGLARGLDRRLREVDIDAKGLIPEAFEQACRQHAPKALFTMPSLHNPTTATLSAERRTEIADIARRHQVALIEDNIYASGNQDMPPPLAHDYPEGVYTIASLSKALAPGLRVGFLRPPAHAYSRVLALQHTLSQGLAPLMADIATNLITSGEAERLANLQQEEIAARIALAKQIFENADIALHPGAPHIWLGLPDPWTASAFVETAQERGVLVAAGEEFTVTRRACHHVRICVGGPKTREDVVWGLETLAGLLQEQPADRANLV